MAEIFKEAGYETGYIGKWHLDGHGRDSYIPPERRQGFDTWHVLECTHDYNNSVYYAGDTPTKRLWEGYDAYAQTEDARAYIRSHAGSGRPFLVLVGSTFGQRCRRNRRRCPERSCRGTMLTVRPSIRAWGSFARQWRSPGSPARRSLSLPRIMGTCMDPKASAPVASKSHGMSRSVFLPYPDIRLFTRKDAR